ncbi:MAG: dephospho-CoA kinase [Clostridiales Family XIII bacterium]|jgi:dephospho-CoA kinase|nr:dephospho-CoA kinase [Clostridiales Family XIII bacterium]
MAAKRIGITGGIGAGKSAVTDYLRSKGFVVIDADEVQREATRPGEIAMLQLAEEIGDDIFLEDGELNRPMLADLMFSDPDILFTVNLILHSDIRARMEKKIAAAEGTVFLSIPLLFESKERWDCDAVWLVTADEDVRLSRAMARDGADEEAVRARMSAQMPEEEKRALTGIVIENNGTLAQLYANIDKFIAQGR